MSTDKNNFIERMNGPWMTDDDGDNAFITNAQDELVTPIRGESDPNAQAIAMLPEIAEALRALFDDNVDHYHGIDIPVIMQALKVLDKLDQLFPVKP